MTLPAPVTVIGAGAAGLSLAYELKNRGLEPVVLEREQRIGHSWRSMPDGLKLVSPWYANVLPGPGARPRISCSTRLSKDEYADYLERYRNEMGIDVRLGIGVRRVVRRGVRGFTIETADSAHDASVVCCCTGYFQNPFTPPIDGAEGSPIPSLHFNGYRNPEQVKGLIPNQTASSRPRVLIVGKRLSAGQALVELHDAGFQVSLSARRRVDFNPRISSSAFGLCVYPKLERLQLRIMGPDAAGPDVKMEWGRPRQLCRSGEVKIHSQIDRFADGRVLFSDGTWADFDIIFYATGFRPNLRFLEELVDLDNKGRPELDRQRSSRVEGLHFLGIDRSRTFRSRFLRGIREDAAVLATEILHADPMRRSTGRPSPSPTAP